MSSSLLRFSFTLLVWTGVAFGYSEEMAKKIYSIKYVGGADKLVYEDGREVELDPKELDRIGTEEMKLRDNFFKSRTKENFDKMSENDKLTVASQYFSKVVPNGYGELTEGELKSFALGYFLSLGDDDRPEIIVSSIEHMRADCVGKPELVPCLDRAREKIERTLPILAQYNKKYMNKAICSLTSIFQIWDPAAKNIEDVQTGNLLYASMLNQLMENSNEFSMNKNISCGKGERKYNVYDRILHAKNFLSQNRRDLESRVVDKTGKGADRYMCQSEHVLSTLKNGFKKINKDVIGSRFYVLVDNPNCMMMFEVSKTGKNSFTYTKRTTRFVPMEDPVKFSNESELFEKVFGIKIEPPKSSPVEVKVINRPTRAGK